MTKKTPLRSNNSPTLSDPDTDGKTSPSSLSGGHEEISQEHETSHNTLVNSASTAPHLSHHHSLSKTSVFERLYKSNIAAHMNSNSSSLIGEQSGSGLANAKTGADAISSSSTQSLKKNMSLSSASLASSVQNATNVSPTANLSRKSNWAPRPRASLSKSTLPRSFRAKQDDEESQRQDDESAADSHSTAASN